MVKFEILDIKSIWIWFFPPSNNSLQEETTIFIRKNHILHCMELFSHEFFRIQEVGSFTDFKDSKILEDTFYDPRTYIPWFTGSYPLCLSEWMCTQRNGTRFGVEVAIWWKKNPRMQETALQFFSEFRKVGFLLHNLPQWKFTLRGPRWSYSPKFRLTMNMTTILLYSSTSSYIKCKDMLSLASITPCLVTSTDFLHTHPILRRRVPQALPSCKLQTAISARCVIVLSNL